MLIILYVYVWSNPEGLELIIPQKLNNILTVGFVIISTFFVSNRPANKTKQKLHNGLSKASQTR